MPPRRPPGCKRGRQSRCELSRRGGLHGCPRREPIRRSLRARAVTKHGCSGRFWRSRSVGLRARRAQHANRPNRQYRSPPRTVAADVLSKGHFRDHRHRLVRRQHGSRRADLPARVDQADVPAFDRRSRAVVQLELPRHVRGRSLSRPFGGPLRSSHGVSDQHDLLGARQPRLRRVIDGCHARRLASVARLRHGHGVSSRAIHGVGDHPGRAARPLHRLSRRFLADRLHCLRPSDLLACCRSQSGTGCSSSRRSPRCLCW